MSEIKIINVTTEDQLKDLYKDSALTWEGLTTDQNNLEDVFKWLTGLTPVKQKVVYVTKGKVMNYHYGLTGTNAYDNDLSIVSIKLSDMENSNKVVLARFEVGGRWFDDIVDNNVRRENPNEEDY